MSVVRPHLDALTAPGAPFEVVTETVAGHPVRTYANRPRNLRAFISAGEEHGGREFLVQGERRVTFAAAFRNSRAVAAGLAKRFGVHAGDRVGVVGANSVDWVVAYWAVVALNAVAVPLNAWWSPAELAFGLEDSGVRVAFADSRRAQALIEAGFPPGRIIVWGDAGPDTVPFGELCAHEPLGMEAARAAGENDPAVIFYTSGTTGRPKGSANTHHNIIANFLNAVVFLRAVRRAGAAEDDDRQEIDLCVVPLFHATANLAIMTPFAYAGHKLVFMPPGRFDPEVAAQTIAAEGVTRFGGVPTVVARMLDAGVHRRYDLTSVRSISYGGAPASPALAERVGRAFPLARDRLTQGYGLTETSPLATLNVGEDYLRKPGSVGIALPTCEVMIVDDSGQPLPAGTPGEIWIRGANVIPGYWKRPQVNRAEFTDGFFHTGDIGYLDDEGFLYITDRAKDIVIRGGENVYSAEVEGVVDTHPGVVECAVVGSPHPDLGEEVKCIVVARPGGNVTAAKLEELCAGRLAGFKVPTVWEFRTSALPRNPAGKILKSVLRGSDPGSFSVGADSPL